MANTPGTVDFSFGLSYSGISPVVPEKFGGRHDSDEL